MSELLADISQIVQEMEDLNQQAQEIGLHKTLQELYQAAYEVGQSWSKSWLGYHANVYYRGFRMPGEGAYFNRRRGLRNSGPSGTRTSGDWMEYDPQKVIEEIKHRAGDPDMGPILSFKRGADDSIRIAKRNLLSIIDIEINQRHSPFLVDSKDELSKLSTLTENEVVNALRPKRGSTNDLTAIQQGLKTPPHLQMRARVRAIQSTADAIGNIVEIGNQTKVHISRQNLYAYQAGPTGNRVLVGHGRSQSWRELKDFLEDRLKLQVDEFNRVPIAGLSTKERLKTMLDTSGFAFLVMTGEDEQNDGELRARENVVHEVGLFQGRLSFERAIVLLEQGCQEFSNIHGLGQIRFPKGNIKAAFEEIRQVLEREGLLSGLTP